MDLIKSPALYVMNCQFAGSPFIYYLVAVQPLAKTIINDAQKRQKTPLIVVKSSFFIASRRTTPGFFRKKQRKHLLEYIMDELLHIICLLLNFIVIHIIEYTYERLFICI